MVTANRNGAILIVDDDRDILEAARLALRPLDAIVELLTDPAAVVQVIEAKSIDVVLLDMNFAKGAKSGEEGLRVLSSIVSRAPDVSVVLMTAYGEVALAVEALKLGAADFVLKPWQNEKLIATLSAAVNLARAKRGAAREELQHDTLALAVVAQSAGVKFRSQHSKDVAAKLMRAAPTDANVLLLGESGTGKEVTAREIHRLSSRANRSFVSVDLGAIPESLFESELFGYRRGAFTGATTDRTGLIEMANGGTLLLDEIGNLPLHLQSKLLSILERREVLPLGAANPVPVDIRLISATNLSGEELAQPTRFRRDLLYRIKTVTIVLPSLRERREDIAPLLEHFLDYYARKHRVLRKNLSPAALDLLESYHWPGNIRELRHVAECATILADRDELGPEDFALGQLQPASNDVAGTFDLEQIEREVIRRALDRFRGNVSQAAIALGLTRPALYRRISRHGL